MPLLTETTGRMEKNGLDAANIYCYVTDIVKTIGSTININLTGQNAGNGGNGFKGKKATKEVQEEIAGQATLHLTVGAGAEMAVMESRDKKVEMAAMAGMVEAVENLNLGFMGLIHHPIIILHFLRLEEKVAWVAILEMAEKVVTVEMQEAEVAGDAMEVAVLVHRAMPA